MRNDKYAKAPLLYIKDGQPRNIKANMQHQYISKKHKREDQQETESEPEKVYEGKGNKKRNKSFYELSEELIEQETEEEFEGEESKPEKKEVVEKPFKELTIPEKLFYLANKPEYAPRVSCMIKTNKQTYRGIILDYKDESVRIRSGRRNIEITEKDIKDIRIIGL